MKTLSAKYLVYLLAITVLVFSSSMHAQSLAVSCANGVAEVSVPYDSAITATGGVSPYTFSITTGALAPGLSLDTSTGAVTGTPSAAGGFGYTAEATDSAGNIAKTACKTKVAHPVSIDCPKNNTGSVGVPFSETLAVYPGVPPYTFAIISGSLPPGVTLNSSTGVISGTPTTSGSFFYTAQVTDSLGGTFVLKCSIKITTTTPISLTCAGGIAQVGVPFSSALVATGGVPPYTFSITSGSLPPGLTLNTSTGAITGTPSTYGTYNFTAQVVDSTGSTAGTTSKGCVTVVSPPAISLACAAGTAQVGVAYSSALVATGGAPPYTFSITSGSLPPGLTLNTSTGAITGTPTTYGTYNYTAQVVDSTGSAAGTTSKSCTIVVAPPTIALTCAAGTAQVGVAYSSSLVATGGVPPYTFSVTSGSLPPGLTLNTSTGAITGTPTTYGTYNYTAQVVDSTGSAAGTTSKSCTIVVAPPTIALTCATGTAQVGVAYSSSLVATGGVPPYTFSITSGSLPPGLTLNTSTGAITGTPTTYGTYNYTAKVVDSTNSSAGTTSASCTIVVSPPTIALTCAAGTAQVGVAYSSSLVVTGGVPPYTFSITSGSLPPGLTLNTSTGAITGTPTTYGTYNYTAKVVDSTNSSAGTTSASCTIVVAPPTIALTCASGTAQVGVAYSSSLVATGGVPPYTFSITSGSLPPGLTLNTSTGAITGTPTTYGTYNYTAQVVDSTNSAAGTTSKSCTIVVAPPTIALTCATGTAQVGVAYSSSLVATGGVPPYTFSITSGSLPPGLTLNTSTGAITGTPTTYGTYNYTAKVVDSTNSSAGTTSASCTIVVAPPTIALTCAAGTAQVGVAYSSALVVTGGVPPYTFSITSGSLPPGLTLNTSTGAITGTPTTYGTYNYTAKVVDSTNSAAGTTSASCTIVVSPTPIALQCASANGEVGLAYNSSVVVTGGVPPYTFSLASGTLPPGLTLNTSTGAITGTPSSEGTFSFTIEVTDSEGHTATGSCAITIKTCGTSLPTITYQISETSKASGQIIWFNSHLTKIQGTIPSSGFEIYITGGRITLGSTVLAVPDAVITFTSSVTCASTTFNTTLNRWQTTVPLSDASSLDEVFASGLAYLIPSGFQGVSSFTWSADISSSVSGISTSWQAAASNWAVQNDGVSFPALSESPFVPNYNGMDVNAAQGCSLCSGNSQDQAGAPEFANRQDVIIGSGGMCGQGNTNWTGTFQCAPACVTLCSPTGPGTGGSCLAGTLNASVKPGYNFAGIALNGVDFQIQGPISVTGDLAVGPSGTFSLTNNAFLNSTLFADPSATVQIQSGSGLSGGTQSDSLSAVKAAATALSSWGAGLKATQTVTNIQSSMTITGDGGQNVISVPGTFSLGSGSTLTIAGGSSDTFVFNVPNGMQLGSNSNISLQGVPAGQVLFNVTGSSQVQIDAANTAGIFLAPNTEILVQYGTHNSEFISGSKLVLDCNNAKVIAPSCATQSGTPIVPYIQVGCNGAWQQTNTVTVSSTSTQVDLGPQPLNVGSWSWSGPNGYKSTSRQINNIPLSMGSNVYVATYTNSSGVQSTLAFTITVN